MKFRRTTGLLLGIGLLLVAPGCGSSGSSAKRSNGLAAKDPTDTGHRASSQGNGSLKLVVNGKPIDVGTPSDCNVNDFESEEIFGFGAVKGNVDTGLNVRLPGKPGTLGEREANVILPDPAGGDSYQPTLKVTGSWAREGDTASGHLEGTAKRMSSLTAANPPAPDHFTLDFRCQVDDIRLDDVTN